MKITAMQRWQPELGTAIRWVPTTACAAAAADAPVYDGPLTFLAENHIRTAAASKAAGATHQAYLGSGTEIDGPVDLDAMTTALTRFIQRHPVLRLWFEVNDAAVVAHAVAAADVAFTPQRDETIDSAEDFQHYLGRLFSTGAGSDSFPGLAFGILERPDGFAVFVACDHALSDGASQALALHEIIELYQAEVGGAPADSAWSAPAASHLDYAKVEAAMTAAHLGGSPQTTQWQEIFARHGFTMPRFPLDLGLAPGQTAAVRPYELPLLDAAGIAAFDTACRAAGARFVDGIFAALGITDHLLAGVEEYFGMTVFNTRMALPEHATAQGWYCSFAPIAFQVATARSGASTFAEVIGRSRAARLIAKDLATVPTAAALAALAGAGATPEAIVTAPNLVSYIDFRWFPGVGTPTYQRARVFTGQGRTANASVWINRDHDELYLGSQMPDTEAACRSVDTYYQLFREVITAVAATGGYSFGSDTVDSAAPVHTAPGGDHLRSAREVC